MEDKEILEGKKEELDNLDATSASPEAEDKEEAVAEVPALNNSPVPTEEQKEDADLSDVGDLDADSLLEDDNADLSEAETVDFNLSEEARPVEDAPVEAKPEEVHEELGVTDMPATKTFTQSQVDDIAGKVRLETREKTFRYIYDRYGVENEQELDDLVGNAQRFDSLKEEYDGAKVEWKHSDEAKSDELRDIKEKVALLESGIDKDRYEDAKLILRGKGMEVNAENIAAELATHPEWSGKSVDVEEKEYVKVDEPKPMPAQPVSTISVLGNEQNAPSQDKLDEDFAMNKLFKV